MTGPHASKLRRPGILIVDDDPQVLHLLDTYLHTRGFEVWTASNAQEACERHTQQAAHLDLVLLDIMIPSIDGPAIMVALRQANPRLIFCFMTGDSGRYQPHELLAMGALEVFAKPFDLPVLGDALCRMAQLPADRLTAAPESEGS